MKLARLTALLLLLSAAIPQLTAQQTEANSRLLNEIRIAAEEGDPKAQCELGQIYLSGDLGVTKDSAVAANWFLKAAKQGLTDAQIKIGVCYAKGIGVQKNMKDAVEWIRRAAERESPLAQTILGDFYRYGDGLATDQEEAVKWYYKAAERGDPGAQFQLAVCYGRGEGVAKDSAVSVQWFRKAAEAGLAEAQNGLGVCFFQGEGISMDRAEAVKWYQMAADQGQKDAQYNLGRSYVTGDGVPKDYVQAYKWLNLSGAQGNSSARSILTALEPAMTANQVAQAQQLTRDFIPHRTLESGAYASRGDLSYSGPKASGTGFLITEQGFLISNAHVVEGTAQLRLVTSVGLISANVVKVDAANDLALLKAEGKFSPLPIAASRTVKLGSTVATVGFPNIGLQGFAPKLAKGEIASLSGAADDARYFQISVPVQPGNSGGALVDERGNVVGVVSAKLNASAALRSSGALPENVNYAIKSSYLLSFLESVPEVAAKLKEPNSKDVKFEDMVERAKEAAVLVLVY